MYFLFLDESGRIGEDGLFALGGIAVRDTDWHALRDRWLHPLREAEWPLDREVKWHTIRTGAVPPPSGAKDVPRDGVSGVGAGTDRRVGRA